MNIHKENNNIYICLEGRIDSTNAFSVEQDIMEVRNEYSHRELAFDASGLDYISSAGLRILLKIFEEELSSYCHSGGFSGDL